MKRLSIIPATLALTCAATANAGSFEDEINSRNKQLSAMEHQEKKLAFQAAMSKHYKDMAEAGFFVDEKGQPIGVGDMELLALEVRARANAQPKGEQETNDLFGGLSPVVPMAPAGPFGSSAFSDSEAMSPRSPAPEPKAEPKPAAEEDSERVTKPTEREKREGKQVLGLVEIAGPDEVVLFTNDGFSTIRVGDTVYDMTLVSVGVDSVRLKGPKGSRDLRIDWTKSVRYSDK